MRSLAFLAVVVALGTTAAQRVSHQIQKRLTQAQSTELVGAENSVEATVMYTFGVQGDMGERR